MMSFPVELRNCTNLRVKFNGFLSWKRPIEQIDDSTWIFNRAEYIPELFRQFGPSIVEVSVRFDGFFVPSSKWMQDIVNNTATFCTESMKSFVLMNWGPCREQPKSLFDIENLHQLHIVDQLSIYDSEWSSLLMDQINRIFPKLSKLNFLRMDFNESDHHYVDGEFEAFKNPMPVTNQVSAAEHFWYSWRTSRVGTCDVWIGWHTAFLERN